MKQDDENNEPPPIFSLPVDVDENYEPPPVFSIPVESNGRTILNQQTIVRYEDDNPLTQLYSRANAPKSRIGQPMMQHQYFEGQNQAEYLQMDFEGEDDSQKVNMIYTDANNGKNIRNEYQGKTFQVRQADDFEALDQENTLDLNNESLRMSEFNKRPGMLGAD